MKEVLTLQKSYKFVEENHNFTSKEQTYYGYTFTLLTTRQQQITV